MLLSGALAIAPFAALAQVAAGEIPGGDVAVAVALSGAIQAATVLEGFYYGMDAFPLVLLGTATAQHIPGIAFGAACGWRNLGIQASLDALYAGTDLLFGESSATLVLFNLAHKFSMFATYEAYADLRGRSDDPAYAAAMRRYGFGDLALAPFDPASYGDWMVVGYLGSMAALSAVTVLSGDDADAVWTRGTSYLGDAEFPVWAGLSLVLLLQVPNFIMTGIGEEALYRGVYYEELSWRYGEWPARIFDAAYFTASHLPQQWEQLRGMPLSRFLLKTALSFGQAFWFQSIYERQGLKAAVTAHAVSDVLVFFSDWLMHGGVPNDNGFSINDRGGLSISFNP